MYELCYYEYLFGEKYSLFPYFIRVWSIKVLAKILSLTSQLFNHDIHLNVKVLKSKNYPDLISIKVGIRWDSFVVIIDWSPWLQRLWVFWLHDRNWTHCGLPTKTFFQLSIKFANICFVSYWKYIMYIFLNIDFRSKIFCFL